MEIKFKNLNELQNHLMKKIENATKEVGDDVYELVKSHVSAFYNEYSPEEYERTYQLDKKWVKTRPNNYHNRIGYRVWVYLDVDSMDYLNPKRYRLRHMASSRRHADRIGGRYTVRDYTLKVLDMTMHGSHGGVEISTSGYFDTLGDYVPGGGGTAIWDETIDFMNENFEELAKDSLTRNGIKVK